MNFTTGINITALILALSNFLHFPLEMKTVKCLLLPLLQETDVPIKKSFMFTLIFKITVHIIGFIP